MTELKVHASNAMIERMVHSDDSREAFSTRLKDALTHAGQAGRGEGARLAKIAKVTPKAASKWLNGETRPGHDKLVTIAQALGVRAEWLDYGNGPMSGVVVGDAYRASPKVGDTVREASNEVPEPSNVGPAPRPEGMCPEISWVQAGQWAEVCHVELDPESVNWYPRPPGASAETFVLRVVGESMIPEYTPGTLIYVDPEKSAETGKDVIAVLTDTGEATFKRFIEEPGAGKMLKALNPAWTNPYLPINGNCRLVGVVVADMRMR